MQGVDGSIRKDRLEDEETHRAMKVRDRTSEKMISLNLIESLAKVVDGNGMAGLGSNFGVEDRQAVDYLLSHQRNPVAF
jgi:hypothetical protein